MLSVLPLFVGLGADGICRVAALIVAEHPACFFVAEQVGVALDGGVDDLVGGLQREVAVGRGEVLVHVDVAVVAARHNTRAVGVEELELVGAHLLDKELLVGVCKLGVPLQHAPMNCSTRCHVNTHVAVWIVEGIDAVGCGYGYNHPILSFRIVVDSSGAEVSVVCTLIAIGHGLAVRLVDNAVHNTGLVDVDGMGKACQQAEQAYEPYAALEV